MKKVIILFSVLFILYCGLAMFHHGEWYFIAQSKSEPYGLKYNSTRKVLGITLIPDGWYTKNTSMQPGKFLLRFNSVPDPWIRQVWSNFSAVTLEPFYKEKELIRNDGDIGSEIDRFVCGVNDSVRLMLEVKYNYLYLPKWSASLIQIIDSESDYFMSAKELTLPGADSVLHSWNLSR